MEQICNQNQCCGCEACKNICPRHAINMIEDKYGFKYPKINQKLCINCGMCKRTCPQINDINRNNVIKCYASSRKNTAKKMDSASGGIASVLYETFLEQNNNAVVFGVEFDDKQHAIFKKTTIIDDIEQFKGSKYVQAEIGNLYVDIIDSLKGGKNVLVIGTPCQISAINRILELKKISTDKLITVDLICHGVSSSRYLDENINYLKNKFKWKDIKKITFRSNRKYRNFHFCIETSTENNKYKLYNKFSSEDPYFYGFLKGITLRENCYNCKYANTHRVGDITIGDFIGLGTHNEFPPYNDNPVNTSIILCNTNKGEKYINSIDENMLLLTERTLKEALINGTSLKKPFPKHELRNAFLKNYQKLGFVETMYKIAGNELNGLSKKEKILRPIKLLAAKIIDGKMEKHE